MGQHRFTALTSELAQSFFDAWLNLLARFNAARPRQEGPTPADIMDELRRALAAEQRYDEIARRKARPQDVSDAVYNAFYGERTPGPKRSRHIRSAERE